MRPCSAEPFCCLFLPAGRLSSAAALGPAVAPPGGGYFTAITVTAGCNAWAVGDRDLSTFQLIEHWNGRSWAIQRGPVHKGHLNGVSALSPSSVWAAGESGGDAVFEHWNGMAWRRVPSPLWSHVTMGAVTAISPDDVWAVGEVSFSGPGAPSRTLIVHWNGTAWHRVESPNPGAVGNTLWGIAAISPADIWAAGCSSGTTGGRTLIVHWNGQRWQQTPSPNPPANRIMHCLYSVSATSDRDVWAVGDTGNAAQGVIEHWSGRGWQLVPNVALDEQALPSLTAVAAASPTRAWAAGSFENQQGGNQTLTERWTGITWKRIASPNPGRPADDTQISAVSLTPSGTVWVAGSYTRSAQPDATEYPFAAQLR